MEILVELIIIMIILELIEAHLQKAETLKEMIEKLYLYYDKSVFLFFIIHPTFYFVLFVSFYLDILDFYIVAILTIKTFDMFFKIELIKQCYLNKTIDDELKRMLTMQLTPWMSVLGVFIHAPLLFIAIFP